LVKFKFSVDTVFVTLLGVIYAAGIVSFGYLALNRVPYYMGHNVADKHAASPSPAAGSQVLGSEVASATPGPASPTPTGFIARINSLKAAVLPAKPAGALNAKSLYVFPDNYAREALKNEQDPAAAAQIRKISERPTAKWYGQWIADVEGAVRADIAGAGVNELPLLVAYNIPFRDCGQHSAGGVASAQAYRQWIDHFAAGVGSKPAMIVIEPDALAQFDCLSKAQIDDRYGMLRYAVSKLGANPNALVYIDAGNAQWGSPQEIINRLKAAGVAEADGVSVNVSNYYTNGDSLAYAKTVSQGLGGKHYVIDSSRNGNGPLSAAAWCNPSGRALGTPPQITQDGGELDAYLWIKQPGTSDGNCNGGPSAGQWWRSNALELAINAK
jgi:endoglucanase